MRTIKIQFPQIVTETKEIEVSEIDYENIESMSIEEKAQFIWDNISEQEQQWTEGKKWIENAIECGYSGVSSCT